MPLTVYGSGEQTRGMLNIRDTLACIELAILNPAESGEMRVYNQFTESFSINQIAELVKECWDDKVEIAKLDNPRVEAHEHYYNAKHTKLMDLGLLPHYLSKEVVKNIINKAIKYADRVDHLAINPTVGWKKTKSTLVTANSVENGE